MVLGHMIEAGEGCYFPYPSLGFLCALSCKDAIQEFSSRNSRHTSRSGIDTRPPNVAVYFKNSIMGIHLSTLRNSPSSGVGNLKNPSFEPANSFPLKPEMEGSVSYIVIIDNTNYYARHLENSLLTAVSHPFWNALSFPTSGQYFVNSFSKRVSSDSFRESHQYLDPITARVSIWPWKVLIIPLKSHHRHCVESDILSDSLIGSSGVTYCK